MLDADEIRRLIPHDGSMSLIERVVSFDDEAIVCESSTHLAVSNPLRSDSQLSAINAIEYGAQAMALHGAFTGANDTQSYLVSLRHIDLQVDYLDETDAMLTVHANLQVKDDKAALYSFQVSHSGDVIVSGKLTIAYGIEV